MSSSAPIVALRNVGLSYRRRRKFFRHDRYEVLRSVSFELYQGETLGIVGRNGCGKSTLLRVVAGIFSPNSGRVERGARSITLLALSVGFDPELSGRDNIVLSAMLLGATRWDALENVDKIIDFSELEEFIDEPVKSYSSGMRMRLGFSIAVTVRPDVLLIDEVLGVGDAHFRRKAEAALSDKIASGQTVMLVSHSSSQVVKLCDRVIWLEGGSVVTSGSPAGVVARYEEFLVNSRGVGAGLREQDASERR